jgi:hypothetical protein
MISTLSPVFGSLVVPNSGAEATLDTFTQIFWQFVKRRLETLFKRRFK